MHYGGAKWDFHFTDKETGRAHGFLYKKGDDVEPHFICSDPKFHEGYPVDFIVRPQVVFRGKFSAMVKDWGQGNCIATMELAIDMLPDNDEVEDSGEGEDGAES